LDTVGGVAAEETAPTDERRVLVVGPGQSGNEDLGAILRELREFAGLSRIEAAARLRVSLEYLRLIEAGRRVPALGQMPRFLAEYHALGGVYMPQHDGSLADLIVYLRPDEPIFVEFRSRIREARGVREHEVSGLPSPRGAAQRRNEQHAQLGEVVSMLAVLGPGAVRRVREMLQSELT
jgi:transcriptional regulator with XRE-family HTH domain